MADLNTRISDFLWKNLNDKRITAKPDKFWASLRDTGTEIWLDTGDMDVAVANWTAEMSALTTNNTLLNNEIQKGIYDVFIYDAKMLLRDLPLEKKVKEIAFILNARHGLRLATRFGGMVSVELHTDTAHDINAIEYYGRRFHEICPEQFIIKVPYTAEGLIGARRLKESGVKVNFTLGFSARQNVIVTRFTRPDFANVFLGRIGAFISANKLGDGSGAGEMALISSQNWVTGLSAKNDWQTKLIAASLRDPKQLDMLAGADVFTIPPKVASAGHQSLKGNFKSKMHMNYKVGMSASGKGANLESFWTVDDKVLSLADKLAAKVPETGEELIEMANKEGCGDMFPILTREEKSVLASDGKIPVYERWEHKIKEGLIAPDTLMNLAGLASFTSDQKELDDRIVNIIT